MIDGVPLIGTVWLLRRVLVVNRQTYQAESDVREGRVDPERRGGSAPGMVAYANRRQVAGARKSIRGSHGGEQDLVRWRSCIAVHGKASHELLRQPSHY